MAAEAGAAATVAAATVAARRVAMEGRRHPGAVAPPRRSATDARRRPSVTGVRLRLAGVAPRLLVSASAAGPAALAARGAIAAGIKQSRLERRSSRDKFLSLLGRPVPTYGRYRWHLIISLV